MGGALAKYAAEGVETYLVTATKGERGRTASPEPLEPEAVGRLRQAELHAAARELGVAEVSLLGYRDGELDQADRGLGQADGAGNFTLTAHPAKHTTYLARWSGDTQHPAGGVSELVLVQV